MIPTTEGESPDKTLPILASKDDLVPTGSDTEPKWQLAMKRAVRSPRELCRLLGLDEALAAETDLGFETFVPREFINRMRRGDPSDPLLRQVLAVPEEGQPRVGFSTNPVGDCEAVAAPGVIHKYDGRALVIGSGVCGVHCRYCFRREFSYSHWGARRQAWGPTLDYLAQHPELDEVILSGGDPLTIGDEQLGSLIAQIESIPHVDRIRIHTRMPVVIPQRVTADLAQLLADRRLTVWVVIHVNHPREIDRSVSDALSRLSRAGIPLLNQSVLLAGVNDDAETLIELSRRLINLRVQPYYLHQLDRVAGAAHFEVPVSRGLELIARLRESLPGYAVPTYVVEQAGKTSKTPLTTLPANSP